MRPHIPLMGPDFRRDDEGVHHPDDEVGKAWPPETADLSAGHNIQPRREV